MITDIDDAVLMVAWVSTAILLGCGLSALLGALQEAAAVCQHCNGSGYVQDKAKAHLAYHDKAPCPRGCVGFKKPEGA